MLLINHCLKNRREPRPKRPNANIAKAEGSGYFKTIYRVLYLVICSKGHFSAADIKQVKGSAKKLSHELAYKPETPYPLAAVTSDFPTEASPV
jgi:hypothetical protein